MFDKLRKILAKADVDYGDIRYEVKKATDISFNGKELTQIGSNTTDGYVVRVLKNGGLSSVVFTKEEDADKAVMTAVENAGLIAGQIDKPVKLASTDPIQDTFIPPLKEDPRQISMAEKLELIRNYNEIPLSHDKIVTTTTIYREVTREKHFLSTEGTQIREDLITTGFFGEIMAKDGNLLQNVRFTAGGSDGFATVRGQDDNLEKRTKLALDLLKAEPVKGG